MISTGILPGRRVWWSHFRTHLVEHEAFHTVAASKTVDLNLGALSVDLEREKILPLGAAHMQKRALIRRGAKMKKGVVVSRHVPEIRMRETGDCWEFTQKPA